MTGQKMIEQVTSTTEKQQTYRSMLGRYKRAMDNGFYFEALLIVYAMLEDRLRSFLFYIGAFRERDAANLNVKKTKKQLKNLYFGSEEIASGKKININQVSVKEKIIRDTISWAMDCEGIPNDEYLDILKETYIKELDLDGILMTLNQIDEWRKYRNEVIHGLLNKKVDSVNYNMRDRVEAGMNAVRFLDNQIKCLKRKNRIRVTLKIKE